MAALREHAPQAGRLLRQSVFARLAGYEDVNDTELALFGNSRDHGPSPSRCGPISSMPTPARHCWWRCCGR
jgi:hypothetical protein